MSKKLKNISGKSLALPEIGVVEADAIVTVPDDFNNPNFEVAKSENSTAPKGKDEKNVEDAPKEKSDKKRK